MDLHGGSSQLSAYNYLVSLYIRSSLGAPLGHTACYRRHGVPCGVGTAHPVAGGRADGPVFENLSPVGLAAIPSSAAGFPAFAFERQRLSLLNWCAREALWLRKPLSAQ